MMRRQWWQRERSESERDALRAAEGADLDAERAAVVVQTVAALLLLAMVFRMLWS